MDEKKIQQFLSRLDAMCERHPDIDPQLIKNILHMQDKEPIEKLRSALYRGRAIAAYRKRNKVS